MKRKQGLPTYTPEPLWDYSWFHLLLEILLHNGAPPPSVNRVSGSAPAVIPAKPILFQASRAFRRQDAFGWTFKQML